MSACTNKTSRRGFCPRHYREKLGTSELPYRNALKREGALCAVDGCERVVDHPVRGWCSKHYQRFRRAGTVEGLVEFDPNRGCSTDGCVGKHYSRGFCERHYPRDKAKKALWERRREAAKRADVKLFSFTPGQVAQRISMFSGCWVCGGPFEQIDHVKPLSRGGMHALANLRPICATCNRRKSNRWPFRITDATWLGAA